MDQQEQVLLARAKQGDVEAFERLVIAYEDQIYRLALRLTDDPAEAIEVVQDVLLTLYKKLSTFHEAAAFSTWLYRITVNAAYMKLRSRKRRMEVALEDYLPAFTEDGRLQEDAAGWAQNPETTLLCEEARARLRQAIAQLPPDYRVVFVLKDLEGLSHHEIGSLLDLSVPAVKSRLHRARLFLRHQLATYFARLRA
ncbi:MAG: DNA-directed RNA polymerase sigma-70 factor [Candidatus Tectimicrobiota bacterium]|nr:MAG: DNA-directed RNA polymerase sigma-70 factor [Candidatus Tectomicrobia bacterium]